VANLHLDFTVPGTPGLGGALQDNFGHGTHIAGVIAGALPRTLPEKTRLEVIEQVVDPNEPSLPRIGGRTVAPALLAGMAPACKLVSLKVLDDRGGGSSMNVVRALEYVRKELNGSGKMLRVHGVNLSVGYEFDPKWFACGQSPDLRRGRPPGALRRGGRGRRRQHRLRLAQLDPAQDRRGPGHDHQRPGQR